MDLFDASAARTAIIAYLATSPEGALRSEISGTLGLSQTIVWKHIGYLIEHHAVTTEPDGEIAGRTVRYHLVPSVVMTQLDAYRALISGATDRSLS